MSPFLLMSIPLALGTLLIVAGLLPTVYELGSAELKRRNEQDALAQAKRLADRMRAGPPPQRSKAELVETFGVLSSVVNVGIILESIFTLQENDTPLNIEQLRAVEREAELKSSSFGEADRLPVASKLTNEVAGFIAVEMTRLRNGITYTYTNENMSLADKTRRLDSIRREFCSHLQFIKRLNDGRLPEDLQKEWEVNQCSRYDLD
jgi:hypothetical protein